MHAFSEEICNRKSVYARDTLAKKYNAPKKLRELQGIGKDKSDSIENTLSALEKTLATYDIVREHVQSMTTGPYESEFSQVYATHTACEIMLSTLTRLSEGRTHTKTQDLLNTYEIDFSRFHPQPINQIMSSYLESISFGSVNIAETTIGYFAKLKTQVQERLSAQKYAQLNQTMQEAPFEIFGVQFSGITRSKNREGQNTLSWDDIGGYDEVKKRLQNMSRRLNNIVEYSKYLHLEDIVPDHFLLIGPPGTGKTLLARTFCASAGIDYKILVGTDIRSTYVNGSANNLAAEFEYAKNILTNTKANAYALFIDEFDEISTHRNNGSSREDDKLVNELNQVMDGVKTAVGLFVIGATNHYDAIDPSIKSRFGSKLIVDLPDASSRAEVFRRQIETRTENTRIMAEGINYHQLAAITKDYSCRKIKIVVKHALVNKADEIISSEAIPSITTKDLVYEVQNGNHTS